MRCYAQAVRKRILESCFKTPRADRASNLNEALREFERKTLRRSSMNKDQVEGVGKQVKGKINEVVGNATNDPAQEAKGDMQQAAGKIQKGAGDVREDVKDSVKKNP